MSLMVTQAQTSAAARRTSVAIEAVDLVKAFGPHRAVDGISLSVQAGTVYGLLGPNGAGKTTTVRMLATLIRPDAGQARIFGHDVVKDAHRVRQLIGVTGQYASVDETLTAAENLVLFARLLGQSRREARATAERLLEQFGLTEARNRPLKHFSGGMRRRLDLAASLIATPPLIFLDEPTTGLDPRTRAQMWDTIRQLVREGTTVLLTTQYLDEADQLANRIAVIDRGRVIAEGTPDELKSSVGRSSLHLTFANPEDVPRARAIVEAALGAQATPSPEGRRIIAPVADTSVVPDLLVALKAAGIDITELGVQKPTLDEVFLALTGHEAETDDEGESA
ncbi:ATP-binding cassette domain-containing protein [Alicyclobacillus mali (ex Roth et al. 2021)]|uniref:ATP-binding cassette domain-containing protein n=1 Tax=Alicyclobacillus mali (ex Roth et al. 2021) TaxID=1123961 RepID=UPI001A8C6856|nr:ATP-binding cassette domain-containing protein [Alicyclobacillus mali (ex Roth et al. 2021)]